MKGERVRRRILFLQLPRLDNDPGNSGENLPLAGLYLLHSLSRSRQSSGWESRFLSRQEELLDDRHLLEAMIVQIKAFPSHWTDRFASVAGWERVTSRRVFLLLHEVHRCSNDWLVAAETLLENHFF